MPQELKRLRQFEKETPQLRKETIEKIPAALASVLRTAVLTTLLNMAICKQRTYAAIFLTRGIDFCREISKT
jgi:hypothetical protein